MTKTEETNPRITWSWWINEVINTGIVVMAILRSIDGKQLIVALLACWFVGKFVAWIGKELTGLARNSRRKLEWPAYVMSNLGVLLMYVGVLALLYSIFAKDLGLPT